MSSMALTKKDLQSIKGIVDNSIENAITSSEAKMKQYIASQFRIQNMVLDTQFREIHSKLDEHDDRMTRGFSEANKRLHEHDVEIETLKERVDDVEEQMPLHS